MSDQGDPELPFDIERAPLDAPAPFEIDWGGDGSDPYRPVRAHVLAALRPAAGTYAPPLDALLTYGELSPEQLAEEAAGLGITQEHVPELLRMVRDRSLHVAPSDDSAVYAPDHALGLLAGLELSAEQVAELIPLFDIDSDYLSELLPRVLGRQGAVAIGPTLAYLRDLSRWVWGHSRAADALKEVAEQHPALRDEVVAILSERLAAAADYHEESATGIMGGLVDLKAAEALPQIRRAFELGKIDEMVYGPWGHVLAELGLSPDPDDPLVEQSGRRFEERHQAMGLGKAARAAEQARAAERAAGERRKAAQARKVKAKRKAEKASRKANRKRRK